LICSRNGSRDLVGKCAKVHPVDAGLTFGAFTTVFRSDHSDFLFYVLNSSLFSFQAGLYQTSTIYQLTTGTLNSMIVPIPPKPEQRAIAEFLDRETARLDTLVGKKREFIEKLAEKRTALISCTVTHGLPPAAAKVAGLNPHPKLKPSGIEWLGDIPKHWEVKKLSWLFRYCKGPNAATLTKEYVGSNTGDFPVFSGQTENEGLMGMIDDYEFNFAKPVIFVTTVGARAMTTRLVSGKFSLSQNCALIVPKMANLSVGYYNGVLRRLFDFERRSISLIMQPSLRFEDLHKFRVPRPPSSEQIAIAEYLDRETAKLDWMTEKVEAVIEKLKEYRTALITAAVTGKIDVRKAVNAASSTPSRRGSKVAG
jgi:type I restriction enzyme S subunit